MGLAVEGGDSEGFPMLQTQLINLTNCFQRIDLASRVQRLKLLELGAQQLLSLASCHGNLKI